MLNQRGADFFLEIYDVSESFVLWAVGIKLLKQSIGARLAF